VVHVAFLGICGTPREVREVLEDVAQGLRPRPYLIVRAMGEEDRIPQDSAVHTP
jgi:hypothetical protein